MSLALIASPPAGAAFCAMVAFSSSGVCVPSPWIAPPLRLCGRAWLGLAWNSASLSVEWFMPSGAKTWSWMYCSQVSPLTSSISWPAAM